MEEISLTYDNIMYLGNAFKEGIYELAKRNPEPDFLPIDGINMDIRIQGAMFNIQIKKIE